MAASQIALSAVLTNAGISDVQFVKGIIIASTLSAVIDAIKGVDQIDESPYEFAKMVIKKLQSSYRRNLQSAEAIDFGAFTIPRSFRSRMSDVEV